MIAEVGTGKNAPRFVAATDGFEFVAYDPRSQYPACLPPVRSGVCLAFQAVT